MKKGVKAAVILVAIVMTALFLCAAAPVKEYTYKVILPDTPLYAEADLNSEVLIKIPQNVAVELDPDKPSFEAKNVTWQPVKYTNLEGYVVKEAIYASLKKDNYDVLLAKAKSKKMGESVLLYGTHSENFPSMITVHDGERLCIIQDGVVYGDDDNFYKVEFNNEYYFVLKDNVTTGLSYNQTIGVIIVVCFAVVIAAVILTVFLVRRKKRYKND